MNQKKSIFILTLFVFICAGVAWFVFNKLEPVQKIEDKVENISTPKKEGSQMSVVVIKVKQGDAKNGGLEGEIKVELNEEKAPISVKNFLAYVDQGHYNGVIFHRVIPGFMIQGGGMLPDMSEKKPAFAPIQNEAHNGLKNERGSLAMARTGEVNSATAQFFINIKNNTFLDHKVRDYGYAVFGKVIEGMELVDKIERTSTTTKYPHQNVPVNPVVIVSVEKI